MISPDAASPKDTGALPQDAWSAYQKAITLLAALAVIFDGFDIQILGFAIPSIMREWHVARATFAPVAALGLAGMACGSPFAGYCGDRFGRRITLIGCVLLFGLATLATAFCGNVLQLGILRTIAGIGVGGALPNASALVAEFAPLRRRAAAVNLTIVCVPLGGMVAGVIAARVLPVLGWHVLYMIGGGSPLFYALVLLIALPESPGFLARHPKRHQELMRVLARTGQFIHAKSEDSSGTSHRVTLRELFAPALRRDTLALWLAYFASLNGIYLVLGWLPTMLTAQGLDVATAGWGLASYNFGGVFGALAIALLVSTTGSRGPLLWASLAGSASAFLLRFVPIVAGNENTLLIAGIGLHGLFANAVQTTMFALAAHIYPTRVRATGIACAASVGRVGAMLSSLSGAVIIQSGSGTFLTVLSVAMAVTFLGLALVRNHCPGRRA